MATSGSLGILKFYFPNLHKDACSLLHTPRNVSLQMVVGGEYYHFGILAMQYHAAMHLLQIDIDGLPLLRSSNLQFWLIL